MRPITTIAAVVALGMSMAACETLNEARPAIIRNTGLGDRCADYMRLSYPGIKIDIKTQHVDVSATASGALGLMIVDVQGARPDIPASGGFLANEVAARCRFENGVLTQFRWTKGPFRYHDYPHTGQWPGSTRRTSLSRLPRDDPVAPPLEERER